MGEAGPSLVGVLGYRRSRHNSFGMQARLVTLRDGVLRVRDRRGEENESVDVSAAAVELKRGMVRIATGERAFYLFGMGELNKIPEELVRQAVSEPADVVIGPARGAGLKSAFNAAQQSRRAFEALLANGAQDQS